MIAPHEALARVRSDMEIYGSRASAEQKVEETMALATQEWIQPIVDKIYSMEYV